MGHIKLAKKISRVIGASVLAALLISSPASAQNQKTYYRGEKAIQALQDRLRDIQSKVAKAENSPFQAMHSGQTKLLKDGIAVASAIGTLKQEILSDIESMIVELDPESSDINFAYEEPPFTGGAMEGEGGGDDDGGDGGPEGGEDIALSEAFELDSNPGASKTIYLNFKGGTVTGTAWNSYTGIQNIVYGAFDTDGDPNSFSDSELQKVINTWLRAREDFAPFDVNVTTRDFESQAEMDDKILKSGAGDESYGAIAAITSTYIAGTCANPACGGVAWLNAVGSSNWYKHIAFGYAGNLGNNAKYIGEVVSHELGHNLGLSHDGTSTKSYYRGHGGGEIGWAPIMGAAYNKNIGQWSKGEYANANNTQDDISIITSKLGLRDDDHGDDFDNATLLTSPTVDLSGIIESRTDVDVFKFVATADNAIFSVTPWATGPNVDTKITLYDESGTKLDESNPDLLLSSQIDFDLPALGTYYIAITGVGRGDPLVDGYTDYSSIGTYFVSGFYSEPENLPPVANASADVTIGDEDLSVTFSGSNSTDSDGNIVEYTWDFGDDSDIKFGESVNHVFKDPGTFTTTLMVTDDDGASHTDTLTIVVKDVNDPPIAIATADVHTGPAPLVVNFDSSASSDPDGTIFSYTWEFGDGKTGGAPNPEHTFLIPGTYHTVLFVRDNEGDITVSTPIIIEVTDGSTDGGTSGDDDGGATDSGGGDDGDDGSDGGDGDLRKEAPIVHMSTPSEMAIGESVNFVAEPIDKDGFIVSYLWDFGDGNTSNEAAPQHTYAGPGEYQVTLTVTDNDGLSSTTTSTIVVKSAEKLNKAPIAIADFTKGNYDNPLTVDFDASQSLDPDGSITSYQWDFGDGSQSTEVSPTYTYDSSGKFEVKLTIVDDIGALKSTTVFVTIDGIADKQVKACSNYSDKVRKVRKKFQDRESIRKRKARLRRQLKRKGVSPKDCRILKKKQSSA